MDHQRIVQVTVLLLLLLTGLDTLIVFEALPSSKTICLGEYARFQCSSNVSSSRLFWFINKTFVNALPKEYQISYSVYHTETGKTSILQILGLEATNNSMVECAADISDRISHYSTPVSLKVVRLPSPPTDLTIEKINTSIPTITLTWEYQNEDNESDHVHYKLYTINATSNKIISTIYTNQTYHERSFNSTYSDQCNSVSFILFCVRTVRFQPMTCSSVKSKAVEFETVSRVCKESAATKQSYCAYIVYAVEVFILSALSLQNCLRQLLETS